MMHVANRNESVSSPLSRWPRRPPVTRGAVAFLACLRRRTRVSAQSRLTAATPRALGCDLSRGAGDYTPRDKPICAINYSGWARVCVPTPISPTRGNESQYEYCIPSTLRDSSRNGRGRPSVFPAFFSSFCLFFCFPSHPCLLCTDARTQPFLVP